MRVLFTWQLGKYSTMPQTSWKSFLVNAGVWQNYVNLLKEVSNKECKKMCTGVHKILKFMYVLYTQTINQKITDKNLRAQSSMLFYLKWMILILEIEKIKGVEAILDLPAD